MFIFKLRTTRLVCSVGAFACLLGLSSEASAIQEVNPPNSKPGQEQGPKPSSKMGPGEVNSNRKSPNRQVSTSSTGVVTITSEDFPMSRTVVVTPPKAGGTSYTATCTISNSKTDKEMNVTVEITPLGNSSGYTIQIDGANFIGSNGATVAVKPVYNPKTDKTNYFISGTTQEGIPFEGDVGPYTGNTAIRMPPDLIPTVVENVVDLYSKVDG